MADVEEIRKRILPEIAAHGVEATAQDVLVESDQDDDGYDFLRVLIRLQDGSKIEDSTLEELLESIESAVESIDERYVSIRFDEAA